MFGKRELIDSLSRDLTQARNKRDTFAASMSKLTAEIAELEARLSAETERLERERAALEIVAIKKTSGKPFLGICARYCSVS